jgi:hypothetical protein
MANNGESKVPNIQQKAKVQTTVFFGITAVFHNHCFLIGNALYLISTC